MKKILDKIGSLSGGTLLRTVLQILIYINQIVAVLGASGLFGFADNIAYQIVTLVLTIAITTISYWYNNDWTKIAQLAGDIYSMLKDGKITKEEVEEFVKKHKKETETPEEETHE